MSKKMFASVVLSTAIVMLWLNWVAAIQAILFLFVCLSVIVHFTINFLIVKKKVQELSKAKEENIPAASSILFSKGK